jgi:hypothetical protein
MKIEYNLQTPWPTDISNPEKYEALDWKQEGIIPFLPVAGMLIDCGDGDYRVVDEVYWHSKSPNEVIIHFQEEDSAHRLDYWTRGGWTTTDIDFLPRPSKRSGARSRK